MNNLFAACIECNIEKGTMSSRTVRSLYNNTRAPYRKEKKQEIREDNIATGMVIGGIVGLIGGPWGVTIGATLGGMIGKSNSPNT